MHRGENQQTAQKPCHHETRALLIGLGRKVYSDQNFLPCPSLYGSPKLLFKKSFSQTRTFCPSLPFYPSPSHCHEPPARGKTGGVAPRSGHRPGGAARCPRQVAEPAAPPPPPPPARGDLRFSAVSFAPQWSVRRNHVANTEYDKSYFKRGGRGIYLEQRGKPHSTGEWKAWCFICTGTGRM